MTDGWTWVIAGYVLTAVVWAGYAWWSGRGADR
jgi:predicted negative regulator of RcsB-dependent stress response